MICSRYDPSDPGEVWEVETALCEIISAPPHVVRSCGGGFCERGVWRTENFDRVRQTKTIHV